MRTGFFNLLLFVFISFVKCNTSDDGYVFETLTQNVMNPTFNQNLNFTVSQHNWVFMYSEKVLFINYTAVCKDDSEIHRVQVSSEDRNVIDMDSYVVELHCSNMSLVNDSGGTDGQDGSDVRTGVLSIKIHARLIGLGLIDLSECSSEDANFTECKSKVPKQTVKITIMRKMGIFDIVFKYFIMIAVIFITTAFGCKLDLGIVKECLKKPVALFIGFGCQYLLMPMVGRHIYSLYLMEK